MQRRYSEQNTYIDTPPSIPHDSDELYDDVASLADPDVRRLIISQCLMNPQQHVCPLNVSFFYATQDVEEIINLPNCEDASVQEHNETCTGDAKNPVATEENADDRIYLDLVPVRSFLHTSGGAKAVKDTSRHSLSQVEDQKESSSQTKEVCDHDPWLEIISRL